MEIFDRKLFTFTHRTREDLAVAICAQGFAGRHQLVYTSDYVSDVTSFAYFTGHRKAYGEAIVVLQLPRDTLAPLEEHTNCEYLREIEQREDMEPNHLTFLIPPRYVRGYFLEGLWVENPLFSPENFPYL